MQCWSLCCDMEVHDRADGGGTIIKAGRSWLRFPISLHFSIFVNFPASIWSLRRLSLYHNLVRIFFVGVKGGLCVRLANSPPSVSRLSRQVGASTSHIPIGIHELLPERAYIYRLLNCQYFRLCTGSSEC
jgi:hypothetical protein